MLALKNYYRLNNFCRHIQQKAITVKIELQKYFQHYLAIVLHFTKDLKVVCLLCIIHVLSDPSAQKAWKHNIRITCFTLILVANAYWIVNNDSHDTTSILVHTHKKHSPVSLINKDNAHLIASSAKKQNFSISTNLTFLEKSKVDQKQNDTYEDLENLFTKTRRTKYPQLTQAIHYYRSGELELAITVLNDIALTNPEKVFLAFIYEKLENVVNASAIYRSIDVKADSNLSFIYGRLAQIYFKSKQYAKAAYFSQVYLPYTNNPYSQIKTMILSYYHLGKLDFLQEFIHTLQEKPTSYSTKITVYQWLYLQTLISYLQRDYTRTILMIKKTNLDTQITTQSVKKSDRHAILSVYELLALAYLHKNNTKDARLILEKAITMRINKAAGYYLLAEVCYVIGDYRCTDEKIKKTLQLDPLHAQAIFLLSEIHLACKEKSTNFIHTLSILKSNPSFMLKGSLDICKQYNADSNESLVHLLTFMRPHFHNQRQIILRNAGLLERLKALSEAENSYLLVKNNFSDVASYQSLAEFYNRHKRLRPAELVYLEAIEYWPYEGSLYGKLAEIYIDMKEQSIAKKYLSLFSRHSDNPNQVKLLEKKIEAL